MVVLVQLNELFSILNTLQVAVSRLQLSLDVFNYGYGLLAHNDALHFNGLDELVPRMFSDLICFGTGYWVGI